jgi:hypothetical protein
METIKLRPHHLLCTQGYSGKGYSDAFVSNMDDVVERLRSNQDEKVEIVFTTDNLCENCPSKISNGVCESDDKVLRFDKGVIDALGLDEGIYSYQDLITKLDEYLAWAERALEKNSCQVCIHGHHHVPGVWPVRSGLVASPGEWIKKLTYLRFEAGELSIEEFKK